MRTKYFPITDGPTRLSIVPGDVRLKMRRAIFRPFPRLLDQMLTHLEAFAVGLRNVRLDRLSLAVPNVKSLFLRSRWIRPAPTAAGNCTGMTGG